jgi:DNA-binding response OmpR family regulator
VDALAVAKSEIPDLVVLDLMLPGLDGYEVCRRLRQTSNVPILMLTARADEVDKIVGLEMGADDCLTKPFSMRELTARVKALLGRVRLVRKEMVGEQADDGGGAEKLTLADRTLDLGRHELLRDGVPLPLKPKEYDLLVFLARNRGIVLTRDVIKVQLADLADKLTASAGRIADSLSGQLSRGEAVDGLDDRAERYAELLDSRVTIIAADGTQLG